MSKIKQSVDLIFFDSSIPDTATWMATLRYGAPIGCFGLDEMQEKIGRLCGSGNREIARLTIIGHGDKWHQSIGVNELRLGGCDYGLGKEENAVFRSIKPFFASNAVIVLGGCRVGSTDGIVNALSRILPGIKVRAFTAEQRPALLGYLESQGGMVESVNGQVVTRTASNSWDTFDRVLYRIFGTSE